MVMFNKLDEDTVSKFWVGTDNMSPHLQATHIAHCASPRPLTPDDYNWMSTNYVEVLPQKGKGANKVRSVGHGLFWQKDAKAGKRGQYLRTPYQGEWATKHPNGTRGSLSSLVFLPCIVCLSLCVTDCLCDTLTTCPCQFFVSMKFLDLLSCT
jgi:hypothetical protein